MTITVHCAINGQPVSLETDMGASLLDMLRAGGLTGAKRGCGVGECGACTVLLDDVPMNACLYLAIRAEGKSIRTVEGELSPQAELSPMQRALVDAGAVQCGFCTPGMVMAGTALVEKHCREHPGESMSRDAIRRGMAGNLCRCTGYETIVNAVEQCVERMRVEYAQCAQYAQCSPDGQCRISDTEGRA